MTERQQLLALAGLLYLGECLRWVRRGAVVIAAAPDRRAWRRSPLLHNERGDAYIGWPLPPFGEFLVVRGRPFSCSTTGLVTATAACMHANGRPAQAARLWTWETLAKARASGDRILAGDAVVWQADTPFEASDLSAWLARLATMPPQDRQSALEREAAGVFDQQSIRARLADWRTSTRALRHVQSALLAWMFAVIPAAVWWWGWFPTLAWAAPPVFAASAWIARRFARLAREWHPSGAHERSRLALMMALSPLTALRASDLAGRSRMAWFHPAAVAAAFLPRVEAEALAASLYRDLLRPRLPLPCSGDGAREVLEEERSRTLAAMASWARGEGWDPGTWSQPPSATDPSHVRYCPRCLTQFTAQARECGECGGLALDVLDPKGTTVDGTPPR